MKLLLINPNTTEAMTELMRSEALKVALPETEIVAVSGRFGGRYVASRAAYAIAGHAALDAYADHSDGVDGVVLACFGDPALHALKEIANQPVVGMAEASCLMAAAMGGKFAIVTGGERWKPMLQEFVALIGLSDRLAAIKTVAPSGAEIARDPGNALAMLADACNSAVSDDGADCVILGGAGLAGIAARIGGCVAVPVIDSLVASVRMIEAVVRMETGKAKVGSYAATPAVGSIGLSPKLAKRLAGSG